MFEKVSMDLTDEERRALGIAPDQVKERQATEPRPVVVSKELYSWLFDPNIAPPLGYMVIDEKNIDPKVK